MLVGADDGFAGRSTRFAMKSEKPPINNAATCSIRSESVSFRSMIVIAYLILAAEMDVPSPIDLRRPDEAEAWAEAANVRRPWRADFFAAIVAALSERRCSAVLELGSGPGFLAATIVREMPGVAYTLLDWSPAMHDLAHARLGMTPGVRFVTTDFKRDGWVTDLGTFDAIVTVQAVHELRHKRHAAGLHRAVRTLLEPDGVYLVCDHVVGPEGMANTELYMTPRQQREALHAAGFGEVQIILEKKGLVLLRATPAA
jgi:SAM-dependent methyltransferase